MNSIKFLILRLLRQFQDYKQYAVTGSLNDNPRLERSVNLFNGLTQWVQCMVLSRSTPQQRAEVIVKLIDVTKVKTKSISNQHVISIHSDCNYQHTEIEGTEKLQLADGRRWRTESQLLGSFNSDVLSRSG